jgi:hypothetical protein
MNAKLPTNADQQRIELGPANDVQQRIELWPIARPRPYGRNPRRCPPQAVAKVAASIAAFGFRTPILVDGADQVIAGHTRLLAARKLHLARVPVIVCADLPPEKVRALRLADNRSAQETSWDGELLGLEISDLAAAEMTGRRCYAMEISPSFCDVTVARWQNFTGHEAMRDGTGD